MKRISGALVAVVAGAILLASCSTIPFAQRPQNAMRIIDLFNSGNIQALDSDSQIPFLFNGEIVELKEDVNVMWTNMIKSGLKIENPQVTSARAIGPESYKQFADSMQVRVFFQKYLPKGAAIVHVTFKGGSFDLLLDGAKKGFPVVIGIRTGTT